MSPMQVDTHRIGLSRCDLCNARRICYRVDSPLNLATAAHRICAQCWQHLTENLAGAIVETFAADHRRVRAIDELIDRAVEKLRPPVIVHPRAGR